ncbi:metabolite traffic protein EboE [Isoptericola variabilis]|uniref:Xylose isomerase domain-containing protein TIM barrel n=1 Tax=Isoptericola variabilis (strain 225) TaxID=743718 RepID=F6FQJ9_ISOV2|nr:metabolite traffic protein EboE [Isoptericola variabilis]AEG44895.1 Xylose isomerase domain-containing protein TIM barrel [Isoptericola variabilis 225]TWH28741.1 xylose isomerase-like TIM barrel protein [Isoptericola variabilis J7]
MLLSYCTNVHPAEDLDGVVAQLERYAAPVRAASGLDELGVGLWLPAALAHRLDRSAADRERLRAVLAEHRLVVHTLNAFPYGGFHDDVVKLAVYSPTWAERARLSYVLACARVLADLLPDGVDGSISTLPLAWRAPWTAADDDEATRAFARLSAELRDLAARTGRVVRVAVEPEPGCVLDTVDDVVAWLAPRTAADRPDDVRIDPEHVGVCLDTCHLAVSFADPAGAVRRITDAGLRVVKVQASAALHVADPSDPAARAAVGRFAEQRYLHQTRELGPDGTVRGVDDLPPALAGALPGEGPWRVHFHVPLHHEPAAPLGSTTDVLREAVAAVAAAPHGDAVHLDVETYTWSVLPPDVLPGGDDELAAGIAAEVRWAAEHLLDPAPAAAGRPERSAV